MSEKKSHLIVAYYHLSTIEDPRQEVKLQKKFFADSSATSRIYVSEGGINCQMSAIESEAIAYMEWMRQRPNFEKLQFKVDAYHENVFPRLAIKYRRQLVAFDAHVDLTVRGEHLAPDKWKEMLEKNEGHLLLDIRNDYEWEVGRFDGAERPPCQTSRGFIQFAEDLKKRVDPKKTPVMMYCTGGIRCELFSALLKKDGFEKVYQLDGGIINYGQQQGNDHWLGKLYVFDDRMTVPIGDEQAPVVGTCHHCGVPNENYLNCANTDCNELFLCCQECTDKFVGCCQTICTQSKRLRPYQQQYPNKPFRKLQRT